MTKAREYGPNKMLIDYIDNLEKSDWQLARRKVREIKSACGISNWIYGNWRACRTRIKKSDQIIINSVLQTQLFPIEIEVTTEKR